ncbi:MAG: hypothetical protein IM568_08175 [Flavobacterium sp.]|nr:hypothetical protein [Flavobacterium sp.]
MKKIILPVMIVAIIVGLYEQTKEKPNVFILAIAVVIFIYGMIHLSAKTPSKYSETEEEQDNDN